LYSQSVVENYKDKIIDAWKDEDLKYLANLDYIALIDWITLHRNTTMKGCLIMIINYNLEGAWRICENINGYLETQVYYFYTSKDAIRKSLDSTKKI
jgi:hypothetical protein